MSKEIAEALMVEAKSDLDAAKLLLEGGIYSRSIYHSQQAVEKAMKSCLALAGRIITDDHWVSDRFIDTFREMPNTLKIVRDAKFLEHQGTRSRYPLFRDSKKPLWIPSKEYTKDDANSAYKKAEYVFNAILEFLKDKYEIEFEVGEEQK